MPITQNLFHTRTVKKALTASSPLKNGEIPAKAKAILQKWHDLIQSNKIQKHKESNLQSLFASELCGDVLGYKPVTKKVKNNWTLVSEEKVGAGSVDICLGKFNDESRARLVMLELKGPNTTDMDRAMLGRDHSTVEQARNYAYNSNGEAQWFIVSNCIEIRLYKYPESGKIYQSWQIADLIKPEEYARFILLLGAKNLITGKTEKLYKQSLQAEKDITNELYSDYRDIRIKMINGMKRENNRIRRADMIARAQTLLDRVLFIAFAEDRELLPQRTLQEYIFLTLDNSPLSSWDRLKILFNSIDKGNPKQGNSIINHKKDDKNAFSWTGQFTNFDVVLGNPPYVRQERLSDIKPYLEANYQTYHGVADLYTYFFELGINILKKGGYLGYISSSTFFKTGSGESLRKHLSVQANIEAIVDFGDLQVFEGVTTYPAILVMSKPTRTRQKAPDTKLNFWNVEANKLDDLKAEMLAPKWGEISQNKLADDGWRLEDERLQALRHKIVKNKPTLKEVYGSPLYGLKTGLNAAFIIDEDTYNRIITVNPSSLEILKRVLVGKDIKKWRSEPQNLYLILFPRGWTRKQMGKEELDVSELEAWQWLQQQYPKICEWLESFTEKGRKRGDKGEFWWELRACAYYDAFETQKIIYNRFQSKPLFFLDTDDFLINDAPYFIPNSDELLLGILNSNVYWFLITAMVTRLSGGFFQVHAKFMDRLPIPKATKPQQAIIASLAESCQTQAELRYQLQNSIRKNIPSLCPDEQEAKLNNKLKSWWMLSFEDFQKEIKKQYKHSMTLEQNMQWQDLFESHKQKIQQNSAELAQKEQQLNQAVYELFGLDEAEIKLLEESLR